MRTILRVSSAVLLLLVHPVFAGMHLNVNERVNLAHATANNGITSQVPFVNPELNATVINQVSVNLIFTDRSTQDTLYEIFRTSQNGGETVLIKSFSAPGTDGLYIFFDYSVTANTTYTYTVRATAGTSVYPDVASVTVNTANQNPLDYPTFESFTGISVTETSFEFGYHNPTPGAFTEIYRSLSHDGPFELIATVSGTRGRYINTGLMPGTTYFYTLRAVQGGQTSAFAGIPQITTFSDFKLPEFSLEALSDGTVEVTLHDRGISDVRYELIREDLTDFTGELIETFILPDSGTTITYIDDNVIADHTYAYILDVFLESGLGGTVGVDTITVMSTIPSLSNFYLVDPPSDMDFDILRDGSHVVIEGVNIRADANELTSSVVFYLDGKRSRDNTAPFALFQESHGDFKKGHLKNGTHTLMAIAYSEKDGKGTPGDTLTVTFTVENTFTNGSVNVYPNPVKENSTVEVNGIADSPVMIALSDPSGLNVKIVYRGRLDSKGSLQFPLSSQGMKKGVYILSVDVNGDVTRRRLAVE
jgi:hypothetical protein